MVIYYGRTAYSTRKSYQQQQQEEKILEPRAYVLGPGPGESFRDVHRDHKIRLAQMIMEDSNADSTVVPSTILVQ